MKKIILPEKKLFYRKFNLLPYSRYIVENKNGYYTILVLQNQNQIITLPIVGSG
jgi:hypothetical protein